ncbi:DUF3180 family protein [Leucobacter denitrificans]|uniref:DUF3180 family protein n=1 Tax=Leucobacter denitrificans TaxID=683042 RepID=A0A7G9S4B8_9MICO|nr:DUF3180 family protein [Leucobacter denitrificans]QNN62693.1 DUF3180 family protein [Leucobacter denitrificans]
MSRTPEFQKLNPVNLFGAIAIGVGLGLAVQFILKSRGLSPLVPPYSMAITLVLLAALLIVLGLRLRRHVATGTGAVNPFQAVRLLATARAGQIVGSLFSGFGGGLLLILVGRSVPAPSATWLPMVVTGAAGLVLLVCAIIAERMCRVPPNDTGEDGEEDTGLARLEA